MVMWTHVIPSLMTPTAQRLNRLAELNQSRQYLEIGVEKGLTFESVSVHTKVAVDPEFRFNHFERINESTKYYSITSDEFFATTQESSISYDLIFLDGLHTFNQTFRDFCATLSHSHAQTIWLIDDVLPESSASSQPEYIRCQAIKDETGDQSMAWMGDVYKVIFAIHDFFPQFSFYTFSEGHGQTVVFNRRRSHFKPFWNSLKAIEEAGFDDFILTKRRVMNLMSSEEIYSAVSSSFSAP